MTEPAKKAKSRLEVDRRTLLISAGAAAAVAGTAQAQSGEPILQTSNGPVRGRRTDGVNAFLGVRYGADTGARRFRPPVAPAAWSEPANAFEYGASCPQRNTRETHQSEDCLFLNVWTPGLNDGGARPVMVYFHGGAYSAGSGSSPLYDGANLCRRGDVTVVTVNHRLNAFGYLYLQRFGEEAFADSGNVGQLDLILALQWVRDNARAFGGDPNRVMVFGQSGGGAKIATLMATPSADRLFHAAASMSGQQVTASGPANATARTRAFCAALGVAPDDIDGLLAAPAEALVEALSADDPVLPYGSVYFGPVLDERSLTRHPFYPDAAPQSAAIPMIIGNTHDETRAFLRDEHLYSLTWDEVPGLLIPNMRIDIRPETVVTEYRRLYPELSPSDVFFRATTAARSWRAAIIEAEERARQGAQTYAYQLNWGSPVEPHLGAPHTFDIPLVFDNPGAEGSLTGTGEDARRMSSLMSEAFIALARTGSPNHAALPVWESYTLENRETMVFDLPPQLENDPRGAERRLFAKVPYVQPGT